MLRDRFVAYVLPGKAEREAGFRYEIDQLAAHSLIITGAIQISVSVFMLFARYLLTREVATLPFRFRQSGLIILIGLLTCAASKVKGIGRWARWVAIASALATATTLIWASLEIAAQSTSPNDFIPGQITLVMLIAVTIVPLLPIQTLILGTGIGVVYYIAARMAEQSLMEGLGPDENYLIFVLMLTLLCSGITAVVYAQRLSNYQILQQTIEAAEALRQAQTRILLSESATSLSRLAAAVSHEMNTPLGALISGIDTLMLLAGKQATSSPADQPRLVKLQNDVRRSVLESAQRLRDMVKRIQRFTNLDQADVQSADLNELLRDVAALIDPELKRNGKVEMELATLPPVVCRPQQLSVAFSNLLHNSFHAVNGDGRIVIRTRASAHDVEVEIQDNGHGVPSEDIARIFDPDFKDTGGRMASSNWSMFNSRQIIREHGGDIRIASAQGRGTTVTVTLPAVENGAPALT